ATRAGMGADLRAPPIPCAHSVGAVGRRRGQPKGAGALFPWPTCDTPSRPAARDLCFRGATIGRHCILREGGVPLDGTPEFKPDLVPWGPHRCGEPTGASLCQSTGLPSLSCPLGCW